MKAYTFASVLSTLGLLTALQIFLSPQASGASYNTGIPGSVIYQTARFGGKSVPIYGVDPSDPTYELHGDNLALYARRDPLLGKGYWAELWMGPSTGVEAGLSPVAGTKVHFRDNISAIQGISNLRIQGTSGGDTVSFQLRVWSALSPVGQLVSTWDDVLNNPFVARGKSAITKVVLGNVSADGKLYVPPQLAFAFEGFGLYIVPEPTPMMLTILGGITLGWLSLKRRR